MNLDHFTLGDLISIVSKSRDPVAMAKETLTSISAAFHDAVKTEMQSRLEAAKELSKEAKTLLITFKD